MYSEKTNQMKHIRDEWLMKYILNNICELNKNGFTENETIPLDIKQKIRKLEVDIKLYFERYNRG
jgi:hypothetical protein